MFQRIKNDYFTKNRIKEYEFLIQTAIDKGFEIIPLSEFFKLAVNKNIHNRKILLIRQDIDTDPNYCREWLRIEKKYKIHTSYFFRLSTLHFPVMNEIIEYGSDCGYHYEELATYAKRHRIKSVDKLIDNYDEIRKEFKINLDKIEKILGHKIRHIASHGDFANRILKLPNFKFINDDIKSENGLIFEAYDDVIHQNYEINIMDSGGPKFYTGDISQLNALDHYQIIHLLIHPRHWRSNFYWNSYENLKRFYEGIRY